MKSKRQYVTYPVKRSISLGGLIEALDTKDRTRAGITSHILAGRYSIGRATLKNGRWLLQNPFACVRAVSPRRLVRPGWVVRDDWTNTVACIVVKENGNGKVDA